jgi:hypothetical protein
MLSVVEFVEGVVERWVDTYEQHLAHTCIYPMSSLLVLLLDEPKPVVPHTQQVALW